MMARISPLAAALTALTLAGCAIGPDYQRPSAALPASFDASPTRAASAAVQADWWVLFQDPTLNQLVERALSHNADVRLAVARVEQADAVAREAGAAFLPEIDGGASASKTQASTRTASYSANSPRLRTARSATLSTSYELDVWGRVRRANESVRASLLASQYARDAVRLSVAGVVTSTYLNLRALDAQLAVVGETVRTREEGQRLMQLRLNAGLSSLVDSQAADNALHAARAQLAELRRQRALSEHQLALLSGQPELRLAAGDVKRVQVARLLIDDGAIRGRRVEHGEIRVPRQLAHGLGLDVIREQVEFAVAVRAEVHGVAQPHGVDVVRARGRLGDFFNRFVAGRKQPQPGIGAAPVALPGPKFTKNAVVCQFLQVRGI